MRLIDADKLTRDLIDNKCFYPAIVKRAIENAPIEDVVARSEFEEMQKFKDMAYAESRSYNEELKTKLDQAKQEVARGIFDEIDCLIYAGAESYGMSKSKYDELRKKYIGE